MAFKENTDRGDVFDMNADRLRISNADGNAESLTTAIVDAVAETTGRDPMEMPPLQEYLDVDALEELVTGRSNDAPGTVQVTFTYGEVSVRADSTGTVEVLPQARDLSQ